MMSILFSTILCYLLVNVYLSKYFLLSSRLSIVYSYISSLGTSAYSFYSNMFVSLIFSIFVINIVGNIPGLSIPTLYYFFTVSISLPIWVALILVVVFTQLKPFISHMLPYGAPVGLMLILPLIEIFSHIIRPFTLMIRLSTNLSSGHIMLYMFSFFSLSSFGATLFIGLFMFILALLELMISMLQAYIFTSLAWMYISETI